MSDGTHSGSSGSGLQHAVAAARQLSDAIWDSLQQELSQESRERAHALSQQLGEIASAVALLVSEGRPQTPAGATGKALVEIVPGHDRRRPPEPVPPPYLSDFDPGADEHSPEQLTDRHKLATIMPFAPAGRDGLGRSEIATLDAVREEGPAAWISLVGRSLARHAEDHLPFAVLLIEIVEVARLERSATPHDLHAVVAQMESALVSGMRSVDEFSRETLGRYWLLTPDTNDSGAQMLAERLVQLVRDSPTNSGKPMEVAIGIAVCPQDGTDAPTLTAAAELGVYTARRTGRSVLHTQPPHP